MINKFFLLILIITYAYSQTGMVLRPGEKAFGMWGTLNKNVGCSDCDFDRSLTFGFMTGTNIEVSYTRHNEEDKDIDFIYYLKNNEYNLSIGLKKDLNEYKSEGPLTTTIRWYTPKGLTVSVSHYESDFDYYKDNSRYECFGGPCWDEWEEQYYGEWVDDFIEYEEKESKQSLSVGKYFKINSYVFGIEYKK